MIKSRSLLSSSISAIQLLPHVRLNRIDVGAKTDGRTRNIRSRNIVLIAPSSNFQSRSTVEIQCELPAAVWLGFARLVDNQIADYDKQIDKQNLSWTDDLVVNRQLKLMIFAGSTTWLSTFFLAVFQLVHLLVEQLVNLFINLAGPWLVLAGFGQKVGNPTPIGGW